MSTMLPSPQSSLARAILPATPAIVLAFSTATARSASELQDLPVKMLDADTHQATATLARLPKATDATASGHMDRALTYSPNGQWLGVVWGESGYMVSTEPIREPIRLGSQVWSIRFSRDGQRALVCGRECWIAQEPDWKPIGRFHALPNRFAGPPVLRPLKRHGPPNRPVSSLIAAISADGSEVALGQSLRVRIRLGIYPGKPVMVTANNYMLKVFNGDTVGHLAPAHPACSLEGVLSGLAQRRQRDEMISPMRRKHEAFWPTDLFEKGIGWVIVARFRSGGQRIETSVFLLDVACLGVKRAVYDGYWTPETYQTHIIDHYFGQFPMEPVAPECARKLVEQAAQYAANLGFPPHSDYRTACRVFEEIRAEDCSKEFTFGREGKPFYVSGPNDTEEKSRRIVEQLARRCGAGNFDYIVALDPSPKLDQLWAQQRFDNTPVSR